MLPQRLRSARDQVPETVRVRVRGDGWDWLWMTFVMVFWLVALGLVVFLAVRFALFDRDRTRRP